MIITKGSNGMDTTARKNKIFAGFAPHISIAILFTLGILLGALSTVLSSVPIFSAITTFVLAAIIFMLARDIVSVCGILLPCLFTLMATGDFSISSFFIGFIFCIGTTAFLAVAKLPIAPIVAGALGYAAAALILDPITALLTLLPILIGLIAAFMIKRLGVTAASALMTLLALSAALILFWAYGGKLSEVAEYLRAFISSSLLSLNEITFVIETSAAEMLAAYLVNILPGLCFAAISVICFVACSLALSLLSSFSLDLDMPEEKRCLTVTPVGGIVFILCFFISAAFSIEGGELEIVSAAADNILVALILPLIAMGCGYARRTLTGRVFGRSLRRARFALVAIALIFLISISAAALIFAVIGIYASLRPITSSIAKKIRSFGQDR